MINGCMSQMGEIVVRYGGWIDKVIGDALMAVFGAPVAHEDDAERAVRTRSSFSATRPRTRTSLAGWLSGLGWTAGR